MNKIINKNENKIWFKKTYNSTKANKIPTQVELALIMEAGYFMASGIYEYGRRNKLLERRYNESINCDHEPVKKWSHGANLTRFMKKVSVVFFIYFFNIFNFSKKNSNFFCFFFNFLDIKIFLD